VSALERLAFPVFSRMVALPGATKSSRGTVGVDTEVAGVRVSWGDWVVGDVDGVVVVPGSALEATMAAGQKRAAGELGYFDALREGATTLELLGLDASLVDEGRAPT
jgi:4-hydroxy-4-methyl-2-oxoglutarate aldolase